MKTKHKIALCTILLNFAGIAMAQDVIVKTDNTTILSKVIEVNPTEVKYKKWSNQDGPTYSISRQELSRINYQNGDTEYYSNSQKNANDIPQHHFNNVDKGYLDNEGGFVGGRIRLNGRMLSDYEIQKLVDEQSFQLYLKGKKQINTGLLFDVIGAISFVTAVSLAYSSDFNLDYMGTSLACLLIAGGTIPTGIIVGASGKKKTQRILEELQF